MNNGQMNSGQGPSQNQNPSNSAAQNPQAVRTRINLQPEQINALMQQYQQEMQAAIQAGHQTQEGRQHLGVAQRIKQVLQQYQSQIQRRQQLAAQQQQQQSQNSANASMNVSGGMGIQQQQQHLQGQGQPQASQGQSQGQAQGQSQGQGNVASQLQAQTPAANQSQTQQRQQLLQQQQLRQRQQQQQQQFQSMTPQQQRMVLTQQLEQIRTYQRELQHQYETLEKASADQSNMDNNLRARLRQQEQVLRSRRDHTRTRELQLVQQIQALTTRMQQQQQHPQKASDSNLNTQFVSNNAGFQQQQAQAQAQAQPQGPQFKANANQTQAAQAQTPGQRVSLAQQQSLMQGQMNHAGSPRPAAGNVHSLNATAVQNRQAQQRAAMLNQAQMSRTFTSTPAPQTPQGTPSTPAASSSAVGASHQASDLGGGNTAAAAAAATTSSAAATVGTPTSANASSVGPSARPNPPTATSINVQAIASPARATVSPLPIPAQLTVKSPAPVQFKDSRPTLTGGHASSSSALNSPAIVKVPPFEVNRDRVLSKRKLSDLVTSVVGTEKEAMIDGDVEELLLDLADEFVTSVTSFACRLAKHRKSEYLEAKDLQFHLERNWNIRVPGFSGDEIRSIRKITPTASYVQKVNGVNMSRAVGGKGF